MGSTGWYVMKDYLQETESEELTPLKKLRCNRNPTGKNRTNRLKRDFHSDISIRKDQVQNRFYGNETSTEGWNPHDNL